MCLYNTSRILGDVFRRFSGIGIGSLGRRRNFRVVAGFTSIESGKTHIICKVMANE